MTTHALGVAGKCSLYFRQPCVFRYQGFYYYGKRVAVELFNFLTQKVNLRGGDFDFVSELLLLHW